MIKNIHVMKYVMKGYCINTISQYPNLIMGHISNIENGVLTLRQLFI